jgi:hypothetical protein
MMSVATSPSQLTQLALVSIRDEAATQEAMA